jgi:hypothetical protein
VPIHRRNLVRFKTEKSPQVQARLDRMEIELIGRIGDQDPLLYEFLEWYSEESRYFGLRVRPGLTALYWLWTDREIEEESRALCTHPDFEIIARNPYAERCGRFTIERYEDLRDELATHIKHEYLDGSLYTGRGLMLEFVWWSAGEWLYLGYLVAAICEFREYQGAGMMPDWRRRRRRRLAAAQRRAVKELLEAAASDFGEASSEAKGFGEASSEASGAA